MSLNRFSIEDWGDHKLNKELPDEPRRSFKKPKKNGPGIPASKKKGMPAQPDESKLTQDPHNPFQQKPVTKTKGKIRGRARV